MVKVKKSSKANGVLSVERFSHFQCGSCKGWWGVGDAPKRKMWICTWCGKEQEFEDKTPRNP